MEINKLINEVTPEMLPKPYNRWANIIGVDNIIKLMGQEGGKTTHLPTVHTLLRKVIQQMIVDEYQRGGISMQKLADKYELSKNTVLGYINADKSKK